RAVQRAGRRRTGTPMIALVGYTNSGKSTLFNRLTGADVFARDMPFATLDPTIRKVQLPSLGEAALIDTVGFISDLPTHLIDSFQATLEESLQADLLVHVRDRASEADIEQAADVMTVLARLEKGSGLTLPPMIEAWNKIDAMLPARAEAMKTLAASETDTPAVAVSALTGNGIGALLHLIEKSILGGQQEIELVLAPEQGRARAWLHQKGDVVDESPEDDGASHLVVRLSVERLGQFKSEFPGLIKAQI
ncbi:MAG: GTPase, partial [Hyphomonas sp.]|uniref:HflX GTPase family protein n=1 Tax=Hyphomonas sp. TaxID=87 RepID=UPI00349FEAF3